MAYWDPNKENEDGSIGGMVQQSTGETNKKRAGDKLNDRLAEIAAGTYGGPKLERSTVADLVEGVIRDYRINGQACAKKRADLLDASPGAILGKDESERGHPRDHLQVR